MWNAAVQHKVAHPIPSPPDRTVLVRDDTYAEKDFSLKAAPEGNSEALPWWPQPRLMARLSHHLPMVSGFDF